jgi:L-2-hydroxyglutarate oxidase
MARRLTELGGEIRTGARVTALEESADAVSIHVDGETPLETRCLVVCGGLMADRLATMMGIDIDFRIVPYRGEYFQLPAEKSDIVRHLIYPVPEPGLPFLGVHLTRMIDGTVTVGPNAVQGWKREGYGQVNFNARDTLDMLSFPGFWRVTADNLRVGLAEFWNSLWKPGYLKQVRKYCPSIGLGDLQAYPAGIRAQAVMRDGTLVHDFLFAETARSLHVCNAPSPAATSAIPIGELICDKVLGKVAKR